MFVFALLKNKILDLYLYIFYTSTPAEDPVQILKHQAYEAHLFEEKTNKINVERYG